MDAAQANDVAPLIDNTECLNLSLREKAREFIKSQTEPDSSSDTSNAFVNSISFSAEDSDYIEHCTRGQSTNSSWFEMRRGMITASNFKKVATHVYSGRNAPSLLNSLLQCEPESDHSITTPSLAWGKKKENTAKMLYEKALKKQHKHLTIDSTGLIVSTIHPFIGCSPDGIVKCRCAKTHSSKLLEIKCPYTMKHLAPKDAALNKGCTMVDGKLQLTQSSEYYHQVQGQMGICGFQMCDLVIFTTRGIEVIQVEFDHTFYNQLVQTLKKYFLEELAPALLRSVMC